MAPTPNWPLLMDAATAARFVSMTQRDFRAAIAAGLLPAGRTVADLVKAGLLPAGMAPALGPFWHRGEIEAHAARLWGLDGQATVARSAARQTARDALEAFHVPPPARQGRPARRA